MYKAYLYDRKVNKPKEIRRFSVDHDVSSSYEYLRKKVASVFPDLSNENFHLQWHDSEGDLIWFNSDEELIEALSEHQGGLFKLMIQEKSDGTESNENKEDNNSESGEGGNYRRCGGGRRGNWWGRRHLGRGGWGSGGWGGWCSPEFQQQMFNHFAGYQQQQQQQQSGCPKKDNGTKDENKSNEGSSNTEPQQKQQQGFPSGEEYLKNVGSAVSDFLKPFGIDVDVSVDHNGIRTSVNTRKPEETTGNKEEQPTCSKNMDGQNKPGNEKAAPSSEDQGEQTPPPPSPFTVPVKVIHESKIKKDDVLKKEKVSSQSSDEGEWTMVKEEEDTTETKPSSSGQDEKTEKQKPSEQKQSASPERKRQPGPLDLLLAMGFKDENGSLERLLNACQNDIGKVLENMEKMNFKM